MSKQHYKNLLFTLALVMSASVFITPSTFATEPPGTPLNSPVDMNKNCNRINVRCGRIIHHAGSDAGTAIAFRHYPWKADRTHRTHQASRAYVMSKMGGYYVKRGTVSPQRYDTDGIWIPPGWYLGRTDTGSSPRYVTNGGPNGRAYFIFDEERPAFYLCQAGVGLDQCARR